MNYVGCKVLCACFDYSTFKKFYMNYVGCKGGRYLIFASPAGEFYMNYVGCKVCFDPRYPIPSIPVLYELCGM